MELGHNNFGVVFSTLRQRIGYGIREIINKVKSASYDDYDNVDFYDDCKKNEENRYDIVNDEIKMKFDR